MIRTTYETLSIVVPVFNEEETLPHTFEKLVALQKDLRQKLEIIFVNDGSRDRSQERIEALIPQYQSSGLRLCFVQLSRNFGHSSAVLAGLHHAKSDLVAIIDADLQDPPSLIPKMIETLTTENLDVVYGQRLQRKQEGPFKRLTAWGFYRLANYLTEVEIPKDTGDFRVMTRSVRDSVLECREHDPFMRGLVAWVGFKQKPYPYIREGRQFGETKYPFKKMLRFATLAIMSFSSKPLQISLYLGVLGIGASALIASWVLLRWFQGQVVPGWSSLLLVVVSTQSILFALLGVQGIYLGRVYTEVLGRPRFLIHRRHFPE